MADRSAPASFDLQGRVALVTGAARGLGAAVGQALAQAGAKVMLADLDPAVDGRAQALRDLGLPVHAVAADVRDEDSLEAAAAEACQRFGALDVMVNNAALTPSTSLWDIAPAEWDQVMAVNLRGCFFGCRVAGRRMREAGQGGRIINMASIAGQMASPASGAHYAASKAGIVSLTRSFATALAPHGVTVNALAPAAIDSPVLDGLPAATRQALLAAIPLGRFGEPQELAAAVVFLASAAGGFITGTTLDLNGGRLMR